MAQPLDPPEPASPFLDLPGELRNRIYRAALLDDHIDVTNASFTEPGLLHACKLIRHEAGPIFYAENTFEIEVRDYDSAAIMKWTKKEKKVAEELKVEEMSARASKGPQTPHWQNLVTAADRLAKGEIKMYLYQPEDILGRLETEKDLIQRIITIKAAGRTSFYGGNLFGLEDVRGVMVGMLHHVLVLENPLWGCQSL